MSSEKKNHTFNSVYYDSVHCYDSINDTYEQAKELPTDNTVEERQIRTTSKGSNSSASPQPLFEIDMDLIDLGTRVKPPFFTATA